MVYKVIMGVTPPSKTKPGYYDKMMEAIAKLAVDDRHSSVKIEFSDEAEIGRACSKIYQNNRHHPAWRYTVITDKEAKAIYVMKVSEPKVNGNGRKV